MKRSFWIVVSKKKREELAKLIMELSKTSWFESIRHDDDEKALILVDEIAKAGWVPIEDFPDDFDLDYNHVALPEVDDIMSRIIHGLPARVLTPANPDGVHIYDVVSKHPQGVDLWKRIPEFDNYEANPFGVVRNRWTRRVLDVARIGDQESVEMHDKDGFPHELNIRYIIEKTFDN
jgi:hypothetical protein